MQAKAGRRRMRNGSSHHSAYIRGIVTRPAEITDQRRLGKIVNRNAAVSRSITIRSTKFAVICTTSCLSRDSSTSTTTMVRDSAPDKAGRRNSVIQNRFRIPHDSSKQARAPKSASVCSIKTSAARCGAATERSLKMPREVAPAEAAVANGPGFGADPMDGTQLEPGAAQQALAGDDQETDAAAGACDVS